MFRKIIIGALSTIVVGAVGVSAYNNVIVPSAQNEAGAALSVNTSDQTGQAGQANAHQSGNTNAAGQGNAYQNANGTSGSAAQGNAWQSASGTGSDSASSTASAQAKGAAAAAQDSQAGGGQGRGQGGGQGNGQGQGQGGRWGGSNSSGSGTGVPEPQNGLTEWLTFEGAVSGYAAPMFTLTTADGQSIPAQLGNLNYMTEIGLSIQDGDAVSIVGYWDTSGSLAVGSITLLDTGQTYSLRDDLGRPLWSGGTGN